MSFFKRLLIYFLWCDDVSLKDIATLSSVRSSSTHRILHISPSIPDYIEPHATIVDQWDVGARYIASSNISRCILFRKHNPYSISEPTVIL